MKMPKKKWILKKEKHESECGEEFKVIFHIFMSCFGLKVKNSLLRAQIAQSQDVPSITAVHFD